MTDEKSHEERLTNLESLYEQLRAEHDERHDASGSRVRHASLVDAVEHAVEQALEPRFESMKPLMETNDRQLAILEASNTERLKRAETERRWHRFRTFALATIVLLSSLCELARALLLH